jgi:hypothetical protein
MNSSGSVAQLVVVRAVALTILCAASHRTIREDP